MGQTRSRELHLVALWPPCRNFKKHFVLSSRLSRRRLRYFPFDPSTPSLFLILLDIPTPIFDPRTNAKTTMRHQVPSYVPNALSPSIFKNQVSFLCVHSCSVLTSFPFSYGYPYCLLKGCPISMKFANVVDAGVCDTRSKFKLSTPSQSWDIIPRTRSTHLFYNPKKDVFSWVTCLNLNQPQP